MDQCVSVIVPIYMVEPYLKRAVDSILNQTYSNLEIILVDDGSLDGCGNICDDYAKSDNRIVVIHKENGGLSDARNAGLDIATGDYIVFVDSDDYIAPDYVETLLQAMLEYDADVAMCSYVVTDKIEYDEKVFSQTITHPESDGHEADGEIEVCSREQLLDNLYDANHRDATYFIVAWNKIYKASLWKDIRFPKGKIHEDEATTYKIYDMTQKGVYIHRPLYGYFSMPGSITRAKFNLKRMQWLDALDERIAYFEEKQGVDESKYVPESDAQSSVQADNAFFMRQIANAKHARANAAIHYYYPLKEELSAEHSAAKRLKSYVWQQWKEEKRIGYLIFSLSAPIYRWITNIDRDKKERAYQAGFILLFTWLACLCFYKLGVKYVDPWDEARHGVNAYEMLHQGNLIESTYRYATDYYNLKPPISMWMIMLSMLIFGKSIFSLRVGSVFCYLLLALVAANFARKRYGRISGLLCLALLSANTTPFIAHMVRAGDADSLYVMLFSLAMICMLQVRENHHNLYLCGLFFALAFLTKSFHAGIIVIIGGLFLILTGELKRLKLKEYISFIASFAIPLGIWGFARLSVDGISFFKEMWLTDVKGRSQSGFGSNEAGFSYYFSYYLGKMSGEVPVYRVVLILLLVACVVLIVCEVVNAQKQLMASGINTGLDNATSVSERKNGIGKVFLLAVQASFCNRDVIGIVLWILIPTFAFSLNRTKLLWYQYPAVTALLIATAFAVGAVCKKVKGKYIVAPILLVATLVTAVIYSRSLFVKFQSYGVDGYMTNDFQLLIQETAQADKGSKHANVYRALPSDDSNHPIDVTWAQQDVYVAECYGDYVCVDEELAVMLEQFGSTNQDRQESILFTTEEIYRVFFVDAEIEAERIASRGEYVAVRLK